MLHLLGSLGIPFGQNKWVMRPLILKNHKLSERKSVMTPQK